MFEKIRKGLRALAVADQRGDSETVIVHHHVPKDQTLGNLSPRASSPAASAIGRKRVRLGDHKLGLEVPFTKNDKVSISLLPTGGTISAKGSDNTYTAGEVKGDELVRGIKLPRGIRKPVEVHTFSASFGDGGIDSKNMTDAHWLEMLNKLSGAAIGDRVVVPHGSDSMALSAFFLSLTLPRDLLQRRKIVLTGSMKPSNSPTGPDGPKNLERAFALAKSEQGHGVLTQMGGEVFVAPWFDKRHTSDVKAFKAVNGEPVGRVKSGKAQLNGEASLLPPRSFNLKNLDRLPDVVVISAAPGTDPLSTVGMIDAAVRNGASGIVFAGTGNGTINDVVAERLKAVAADGVLVVRSSISGDGEIVRNGHFQDDKFGFACAGKLPSPQHARVLAQVALAHESMRGKGNSQEGPDLAAVRSAFDDYQSPEHRPSTALPVLPPDRRSDSL